MKSRATYNLRRKRLARGLCPIHNKPISLVPAEVSPQRERARQRQVRRPHQRVRGVPFGEIAGDASNLLVHLGQCPQPECSVMAWLVPYPHRNALLAPWEYLCDPKAVDMGEESRLLFSRLAQCAFAFGGFPGEEPDTEPE